MATSNNLLIRLIKWAKRQEENFLTEALAHLLEAHRQHPVSMTRRFFSTVTGGSFNPTVAELATLEITTQLVETTGRPDLVLRTRTQLIYIEIKKEATVRESQLVAYRKQLESQSSLTGTLVLLTRYPILTEVKHLADLHVRWFEIANYLEYNLGSLQLENVVLHTLTHQFLELLTERGLAMTQVSWELSAGLKALSNLRVMLAEAAAANGLSATTFANKQWSGIKIGKDYWAGIDFESPTILGVGTLRPLEHPQEAESLGLGLYDDQAWTSIDLESEQVHFFARTRASQLRFLETYLRDSMNLLKPLKLRSGKPATSDPDEEQ